MGRAVSPSPGHPPGWAPGGHPDPVPDLSHRTLVGAGGSLGCCRHQEEPGWAGPRVLLQVLEGPQGVQVPEGAAEAQGQRVAVGGGGGCAGTGDSAASTAPLAAGASWGSDTGWGHARSCPTSQTHPMLGSFCLGLSSSTRRLFAGMWAELSPCLSRGAGFQEFPLGRVWRGCWARGM